MEFNGGLGCHIFEFFPFIELFCVIVSYCVTVWHMSWVSHLWRSSYMSHMSQYYCHVSLVINCVIWGLLVTDFKNVRGWVGQKSDSKAKTSINGWKWFKAYLDQEWQSIHLGTKLIMPLSGFEQNKIMPLSFMPLSFMPLSGFEQN